MLDDGVEDGGGRGALVPVNLTANEWYPVYGISGVPADAPADLDMAELFERYGDSERGFPCSVPPDLVERLRSTTDAFNAVQGEVGGYLDQQRRAAQHAEIERRRAERGQRRPRRRPNPEATT